MSATYLDGAQLRNLLINGYRNLKRNMSNVDELNVFPVPDGDTGKNMTMTLEGGVSKSQENQISAGLVMQEFSRGTLLAARGNSGVILSQFIRGLAEALQNKSTVSIDDFLSAMESGSKRAYKAVSKPVEGTMLTVMREASEHARMHRSKYTDFESCMDRIVAEMKVSVNHTPELLPVLKEAGVIDSGGAGLVCIFEGMLMALRNEIIDEDAVELPDTQLAFTSYDPENLLVYGYCTEFILQLQAAKTDLAAFDIQNVIQYLETLGDSIVAVLDGTLVKVHVHSRCPEEVIRYARTMGELVTIKIENMTVQHTEIKTHVPSEEHVTYAVVAVATGRGVIKYFKNAGVTVVVDGGQTNNPSAQDFINAFQQINADHIIVLPNDSNIILTARQAAEVYKNADIRVIATKSIAEGYSALSMMDLSLPSIEDVISEMTYYLPNVTTGYVTTATRDTTMNGIEVHKGNYIGLTADTIFSDSSDKVDAALTLMEQLPDIEDKQVVTAFCGCDVTLGEKSAFRRMLLKRYPLMEVGLIDGGQDIYSFIFAIE
jgi:hypothetical protein